MNNNDILRSIRYTFDFSDSQMSDIFAQADFEANRAFVTSLLKKDDADDFKNCNDEMLAIFLNGFINKNRGKKDGEQPEPETEMTNNITFRKLRIALNLKSDDILDILDLADFRLSSHELSAFFRKEGHKHYRQCKDQILRNFLFGLRLKHRPDEKAAD
ncbi:MAG: DUF1456 family protein [OCS116 cluster bacterium]|uniref:DUF1456 domain-containing protein n=1 Tax=OCS116 cluster bacterium TaxID=2030921 RepID=A0A2A4YYC8_9PROT|nr:DUF1456 family protein [OCS116 cluster bacterium]